MKIFQLIQKPQLRGAEIFASQLSNHLVELGDECKLITLFEGDARLPFRGEIVELNRPLNKRLWDLSGWSQLADLIKHEKPDILQANAGDTLKFAVLSKLVFGWKTPIVFRNANKMSDFMDTKPKYWLNKFFLNHVAHIISVSESCSEDLIQFFSFPKQKVDTVEIGIELNAIGSLPSDIESIFGKGPVLINVGSFVPEKNQRGLLRIFAQMSEQIKHVQLIIIGKGKLEGELKSLTIQLGVEKQVHFLGYRTDVLEIIKQCSAFVLPSHIEGLPGVILEAMYERCPVVAYDVGGVGEVVKNELTGILLRMDDEESFAKAILNILLNTDHNEMMKDAAYQLVTKEFDNREIAKRFREVYDSVLRD